MSAPFCRACGERWPCSVAGNPRPYRPDLVALHQRSEVGARFDAFELSRVFEYADDCERVADDEPTRPDVVRVVWTVYGHLSEPVGELGPGAVALTDSATLAGACDVASALLGYAVTATGIYFAPKEV